MWQQSQVRRRTGVIDILPLSLVFRVIGVRVEIPCCKSSDDDGCDCVMGSAAGDVASYAASANTLATAAPKAYTSMTLSRITPILRLWVLRCKGIESWRNPRAVEGRWVLEDLASPGPDAESPCNTLMLIVV